jgi:cytidyltransferase-like protein
MRRNNIKKIGVFLGRLQPQHAGHESMIRQIFRENDEVVLCIGSAQKIRESDPIFERNPYPVPLRKKRLIAFLKEENFKKPWRVVTATDIQPESAWPEHLKKSCDLTDETLNTVYFADPIPNDYRLDMEKAGLQIKRIRRKKFLYESHRNTLHKISSATEIRAIERLSKTD